MWIIFISPSWSLLPPCNLFMESFWLLSKNYLPGLHNVLSSVSCSATKLQAYLEIPTDHVHCCPRLCEGQPWHIQICLWHRSYFLKKTTCWWQQDGALEHSRMCQRPITWNLASPFSASCEVQTFVLIVFDTYLGFLGYVRTTKILVPLYLVNQIIVSAACLFNLMDLVFDSASCHL